MKFECPSAKSRTQYIRSDTLYICLHGSNAQMQWKNMLWMRARAQEFLFYFGNMFGLLSPCSERERDAHQSWPQNKINFQDELKMISSL